MSWAVGLVGVVPVVELRGGHDPLQGAQPPPHVGVEEQPGDDLDDGHRAGELGAEPRAEQEGERRREQRTVDGMGRGCR